MQEEPLRYRWKLETPDTDWSPWSEQTQVNYANLAPGTYRLLVQASSDEQAMSQAISAAFTIQKPFWQEWYFRLGILVLLGAVAAAGNQKPPAATGTKGPATPDEPAFYF